MTRRIERVAEAIRRLVSEIISVQLRDPRLSEFITITKVDVTPDLRLAKIYYSVLGDERTKRLVAHGLKSAKNFIRREIGEALKLRYTPDISLRVDESMQHSARIDEILQNIHKEKENGKNGKNRKDSKGNQKIQ